MGSRHNKPQPVIRLPEPLFISEISIEEALQKRRSVRHYKNEPLQLKDISQLFWAAQGITSTGDGGRTAPSAGALYPLELYLVCWNINGLLPGVYHYLPADHSLELVINNDKRKTMTIAALNQDAVNKCAAVIVIAAVYKQILLKYLKRGKRFVHMEAGHAAQNILLQAVSLNIGTVVMGAYIDALVKKALQLPRNTKPLYLIPVGKI